MQVTNQPRKLVIQRGYFGRYLDGCRAKSEGVASESLYFAGEYLAFYQECD